MNIELSQSDPSMKTASSKAFWKIIRISMQVSDGVEHETNQN